MAAAKKRKPAKKSKAKAKKSPAFLGPRAGITRAGKHANRGGLSGAIARKKKAHIPLKVLEHRLASLSRLVESRRRSGG